MKNSIAPLKSIFFWGILQKPVKNLDGNQKHPLKNLLTKWSDMIYLSMAKAKINKKHILAKLTLIPIKDKRLFYMREMKFLNILCERYSLEFMDVLTFDKKLDSLAYLVSDKLKETLDQKFRAFNFKIDYSRYEKYNIGDKVGEDSAVGKKKITIKQFLNE